MSRLASKPVVCAAGVTVQVAGAQARVKSHRQPAATSCSYP